MELRREKNKRRKTIENSVNSPVTDQIVSTETEQLISTENKELMESEFDGLTESEREGLTESEHEGLTESEREGLTELSENWLKFYKLKKPVSLPPSDYIIAALRCCLHGENLPKIENFPPDHTRAKLGEGEIACTCVGTENFQEWVQCDGCDDWYHRQCVGVTNTERDFFCRKCTKNEQN